MINIIFFSKYREQMGLSSLALEQGDILSVADLIKRLKQQYPTKTAFFADHSLSQNKLLIAVNQEITTAQASIKDGDEIAFFPPVTGG